MGSQAASTKATEAREAAPFPWCSPFLSCLEASDKIIILDFNVFRNLLASIWRSSSFQQDWFGLSALGFPTFSIAETERTWLSLHMFVLVHWKDQHSGSCRDEWKPPGLLCGLGSSFVLLHGPTAMACLPFVMLKGGTESTYLMSRQMAANGIPGC